jgi:uncharacterized protein (TIGR03437 family)
MQYLMQMLRYGLLVCFLPALASAQCLLILADQSNSNLNTGFTIGLQDYADATACQLPNMYLSLSVGDGTEYRSVSGGAAWQIGQVYQVQAVIAPSYFELYLNGQLLGRANGAFAGNPTQALMANEVPSWANGTGSYLPYVTSLSAASTGGAQLTLPLQAAPFPAGLMLQVNSPSGPASGAFWYGNADTLTVNLSFSIVAESSQPSAAPYIDAYGQNISAGYPGKIQTDADLLADAATEQQMLAEWGIPSGYDQWGGVLNAGWTGAATGYFYVTQHNGVWWLITPGGNPCFYIGLDTGPLTQGNNTPTTGREWEFAALPSTSPPFNAAWSSGDWGNTGISSVSFDTSNMIRKYGSNWQTVATNLAVQRMNAWGFSGWGKWATETGNLPIMPVLFPNVPLLTRHEDIFNPTIQYDLNASLAAQITPSVNDSRIVGWSYENEYDGIFDSDEVTEVLAMNGGVPAKQALVNDALQNIYGGNVQAMADAWGVVATTETGLDDATNAVPPASDVETLREFFEQQYYKFLYQTFKSLDPNHLYFGFWIDPGWWHGPVDWQLLAPYVDVIGFDRYAPVFQDPYMEQLASSTGKPTFVGEYGFPPNYGLTRGYRLYGVSGADDADSGGKYTAWVQDAARNPWCVGVAWFEYRDEPMGGRGFSGEDDTAVVEGEDYAFGMVDVTDTPKYDLVNAVRTANLAAPQQRLAFAPPALNTGGVVNSASFASPVAPGSLVSIFGTGLAGSIQGAPGVPLPITLAGATLALNGVGVPILAALPQQVNAQIPWEATGAANAQLSITTNDLAGNAIPVPLTAFAPGLYSIDGSGTGQGSVLIAGTGTLASVSGQPARRGVDYISIYCTGLGPVTNQPATGAVAPGPPFAETTSPPVVKIGGQPALVQFSGLAPGTVGLYQLNALVPSGLAPGNAVTVSVSIGGSTSNTVTIAVQ